MDAKDKQARLAEDPDLIDKSAVSSWLPDQIERLADVAKFASETLYDLEDQFAINHADPEINALYARLRKNLFATIKAVAETAYDFMDVNRQPITVTPRPKVYKSLDPRYFFNR
jgi:hypothetical protein